MFVFAGARAEIQPAANGKRVALVIGIGDYAATTKLANPPNDAKLIAGKLKAAGFQLVGDGAAVNLTHEGFERALNDFSSLAAGSDVALFYYAGHGIEALSTNWLLPVTADLKGPTDLPGQAVDLAEVMKRLELSGAKFKLVLLDACRNNPLPALKVRSVSGGGLMRVEAPDSTLISYATKPGAVARDGEDGDSPYSKALAMLLGQRGVPVLSLFNQLGVAVKHMTNDAQQPWMSSSPIEKEFMFLPPNAPGGAKDDALGLSLDDATDKPRTEGDGSAREAESAPLIGEYIVAPMQLAHDLDLFARPDEGASTLTMMQAGSSAFVVGLVVGDNWVVIKPNDSETGYAPITKIPEINNPDAMAKPAQPPPLKPVYEPPPPVRALAIEGRPVVHDTATLLIEDKVVPLSGIEGYGGAYTDGLRQYMSMKGDFVSCKPMDAGRYSCVTRDNTDVALAAILNGAAKAAPGAPSAYVDQQRAAQEQKRGVWAPGTAAAPKPDRLKPNVVYAAGAPAPVYATRSFVPAADGSGGPDAASFESDYGVAEIDGQPVTVINGERVDVIEDDDGGWVYRDRHGGFQPAPMAVHHDLDHFYHARPVPVAATAAFARQHVAAAGSVPGVGQHLGAGVAPHLGAGVAPRPGAGVGPLAAPRAGGAAPGLAQAPRMVVASRPPPAFAAPPPMVRAASPNPFAQHASAGGMGGAGGFARPMQGVAFAARPAAAQAPVHAAAPAKSCKKC